VLTHAGCKPKCPRVCDRPALSCIESNVVARASGWPDEPRRFGRGFGQEFSNDSTGEKLTGCNTPMITD
jgi:hypothetical protein